MRSVMFFVIARPVFRSISRHQYELYIYDFSVCLYIGIVLMMVD